ncbi:MAG: chorismate-binding protein [Pseudomonadota bacterium]|nr:chorismate-binding protein [Pseudomonadota bacterium]
MEQAYVLFDDAREGGAAGRLYRDPIGQIVAWRLDAVRPALARLRKAVQGGKHAAGFIAYEAGQALDPALTAGARVGEGPLLWFGLFDRFEPVGAVPLADPAGAFAGPIHPRIERSDYLAAASEVREALLAGDYYQANLTFGCDVAVGGSPLALFARLRAGSRAGWGGVVCHPTGGLVSLSPEQFFTLKAGRLNARPMKGTAPRAVNRAEDRALADELAADSKQRAENLMIVDLLRNDLARVAETGSVTVPQLFTVESYPTVHQMVSEVVATLSTGLDAIDVIETIFPCGSVTGAPKVAAIQALRRLEPEPRGAYTGSMGWIEPPTVDGPGDAAFNVLIRTLEVRDDRSGLARLGLGSGLVMDSEMPQEWAECLLKGEFLNAARPQFDLIETMRFDDEQGIIELDRHLDRLGRGAATFGFKFDRHGARNELQAATFRRKERAMVRLLLSPTGAMAIQVKRMERPAEGPVLVTLAPMPVAADDIRRKFKTSDRRFYDEARRGNDTFETIFFDPDGHLTEGSFTNIFVERDGRLHTPPVSRGLIPGILRAKLLDEGRAEEAELLPGDLADGFFVGNILRGLMRAKLA